MIFIRCLHFSVQLYLSTILASAITYSAGPIFFEFTVELVYPVPEGIVGAFLTTIYNSVGMIFLFLFYVPAVGKYFLFLFAKIIFGGQNRENGRSLLFSLESALDPLGHHDLHELIPASPAPREGGV